MSNAPEMPSVEEVLSKLTTNWWYVPRTEAEAQLLEVAFFQRRVVRRPYGGKERLSFQTDVYRLRTEEPQVA